MASASGPHFTEARPSKNARAASRMPSIAVSFPQPRREYLLCASARRNEGLAAAGVRARGRGDGARGRARSVEWLGGRLPRPRPGAGGRQRLRVGTRDRHRNLVARPRGSRPADGRPASALAVRLRARRDAAHAADVARCRVPSVPGGEDALRRALAGRRYVKTSSQLRATVVGLPLRAEGLAALITYAPHPQLAAELGLVRKESLQAAGLALLVGALVGALLATLIAPPAPD